MCMRCGTHTSLIGEQTSCHTITNGFSYGNTGCAAHDSRRIECAHVPCNECAKAIIQSGISEVVYYGDKYHDSDSSVAARFMFKKAGVRLTAYTPSGRKELLEL